MRAYSLRVPKIYRIQKPHRYMRTTLPDGNFPAVEIEIGGTSSRLQTLGS